MFVWNGIMYAVQFDGWCLGGGRWGAGGLFFKSCFVAHGTFYFQLFFFFFFPWYSVLCAAVFPIAHCSTYSGTHSLSSSIPPKTATPRPLPKVWMSEWCYAVDYSPTKISCFIVYLIQSLDLLGIVFWRHPSPKAPMLLATIVLLRTNSNFTDQPTHLTTQTLAEKTLNPWYSYSIFQPILVLLGLTGYIEWHRHYIYIWEHLPYAVHASLI